MSNPKIEKIKKELEKIRLENNGILTPEMVVDYAKKNKKSTLHSQFIWDNDKAAEKFRIQQAAGIIRTIKVEIIPNSKKDVVLSVRKYVSLPKDRGPQGMYRSIDDIMTDDDLRLQLIDLVESEFEAVKNKLKAISTACESHADKISKEIQREKDKVIKKINSKPLGTRA